MICNLIAHLFIIIFSSRALTVEILKIAAILLQVNTKIPTPSIEFIKYANHKRSILLNWMILSS